MKIGQGEVMELLEKNKRPMGRTEIAKELGQTPEKVSHVIQALLRTKQIKCIEIDRYQAAKLLKLLKPFRRMRLYYI